MLLILFLRYLMHERSLAVKQFADGLQRFYDSIFLTLSSSFSPSHITEPACQINVNVSSSADPFHPYYVAYETPVSYSNLPYYNSYY